VTRLASSMPCFAWEIHPEGVVKHIHVGGDKACFINALLHKASGIVQEHMKDTYILTM